MTAISFAIHAIGLDMNWRKFSKVGNLVQTDTIIGGDLTRKSIVQVILRAEKAFASHYLAWCFIYRVSSQRFALIL